MAFDHWVMVPSATLVYFAELFTNFLNKHSNQCLVWDRLSVCPRLNQCLLLGFLHGALWFQFSWVGSENMWILWGWTFWNNLDGIPQALSIWSSMLIFCWCRLIVYYNNNSYSTLSCQYLFCFSIVNVWSTLNYWQVFQWLALWFLIAISVIINAGCRYRLWLRPLTGTTKCR